MGTLIGATDTVISCKVARVWDGTLTDGTRE